MKTTTFIAALLFTGHFVYGQNEWLSYPGANKDSSKTRHTQLNYNGPKGRVTVHKDARIDKLGEFARTGEDTVEGVKIDGFRVVIFFDQNKSTVEQQKAIFLSKYYDHRAYIDYVAPNYRVRVGNFRTRLEAEAFKAELINQFPTAIVVKDKIQLPKLESETME